MNPMRSACRVERKPVIECRLLRLRSVHTLGSMRPRPRAPAAVGTHQLRWSPSPSVRPAPAPRAPHARHAWTSALTASLASVPLPLSRATTTTLLASGTAVPLLDPIKLLSGELGALRKNVQSLLGSGHPALDTIAKYYFQGEGGKHVRPMIVLLMSQATNGLSPSWARIRDEAAARELTGARGVGVGGIDDPLEPAEVLQDSNPSLFDSARAFAAAPSASAEVLLPTQRRLAEITEMIHVASLLHDDVIDLADTRRGAPSSPSLFGNKLTVLAGDFLLARASLALSRLGSTEVVELVASVLANLVEGEVMQMKGNTPDGATRGGKLTPEVFDHYMRKTYLKTASLVAKSTRATTILGGCGVRQGWAEGEAVKDVAYAYGRNVGIAFQVSLWPMGSKRANELITVLAACGRHARLHRVGGAARETGRRRGPQAWARDRARAVRVGGVPRTRRDD